MTSKAFRKSKNTAAVVSILSIALFHSSVTVTRQWLNSSSNRQIVLLFW